MGRDLELSATNSTNLLLADDSLEEIYQVFNRKVYGYFRRNAFDHEAAEDLTQEVFCRLVRFKDTFDSDDQIRNWIFKVARNLLIDVLRKKENGSAKPILMEDLPSFDALIMDRIHVEGPEQTFVTEESSGEVLSLIEELSPRYADVIRLRELEGLKYQEIAKELGMTSKAVEGLLHRARAKLKSNYTAFQKNYHVLLVGLGFIPRLLKRAVTASARDAWKGIKFTSSTMAVLGKSMGATSLTSGTGLMSSLLAILVAGGVTTGSVALVKAKPAGPEKGPQVAVAESAVPVTLDDTLGLQESMGLPSMNVGLASMNVGLPSMNMAPHDEPNATGNVALPLVTRVLGMVDGHLPAISLQSAVNTLISHADAALYRLYGIVDALLSGTRELVGSALSLVGVLPGLNGLTAGLVAGLSGISTEPLRNLQDKVVAGFQAVTDPVLTLVGIVIDQVTVPLQNVLASIGGLTGGTTGLTAGTPAVATSEPEITPPANIAPLTLGGVPASDPTPAHPDLGLLWGIDIPLLSNLP